MKRFLFVTLFASLLIPTVAKAERYWLIIKAQAHHKGTALEKIEMKSMEQCEEQGKIFTEPFAEDQKYIPYHQFYCLKGK